jgi:hypothetical protein
MQISNEYRLLHAGWVCEDVPLDVYGTADDEGAEVCAITQAGSRIDLTNVIFSGVITRAQDFINEQAPALRRVYRSEDHAELAQWQQAA